MENAAGRAAAKKSGRGTLQHLDGFKIERIAEVGAGITHAIDEDIVAGVETADGKHIALVTTALTGGSGNSGHVAERVVQCGAGLFLNKFFWNDGDRLRRVLERHGELGNRGFRRDV